MYPLLESLTLFFRLTLSVCGDTKFFSLFFDLELQLLIRLFHLTYLGGCDPRSLLCGCPILPNCRHCILCSSLGVISLPDEIVLLGSDRMKCLESVVTQLRDCFFRLLLCFFGCQ